MALGRNVTQVVMRVHPLVPANKSVSGILPSFLDGVTSRFQEILRSTAVSAVGKTVREGECARAWVGKEGRGVGTVADGEHFELVRWIRRRVE